MKQYSFWKGLGKGLLGMFLFAVPILIANNPVWANLTLGAILTVLVNWAKFKYNQM